MAHPHSLLHVIFGDDRGDHTCDDDASIVPSRADRVGFVVLPKTGIKRRVDRTDREKTNGVTSTSRMEKLAVMESDETLLKQLCDAARRNDAPAVASLLTCRRVYSPALGEFLLMSPEISQKLTNRLFDSGDDLPEGVCVEHAVRALLMAPSAYDVAWRTACEFIQYIQRREMAQSPSHLVFRSSIADIQSFLQQTVAAWFEEDRKRTASCKPLRSVRPADGETLSTLNPKQWILKLVTVVMDLLMRKNGDCSGAGNGCSVVDKEHWKAQTELLCTIVAMAQDLETDLCHSCLDLTIQRSVRTDWLLPWAHMASELRLYLRQEDWKSAQDKLIRALSSQPCNIDHKDLPALAEAIFSLCSTLLTCGNDVSPSPWIEIMMRLVRVAAADHELFSSVEAVFQSNLASLPSSSLQQWTMAFTAESVSVEPWIQANMILLFVRASRKSGSKLVASLVARTFRSEGEDAGTIEVGHECWKRIVHFALPKRSTNTSLGKHVKSDHFVRVVQQVKELFHGVSYVGQGCYDDEQGKRIASLTQAGSLVFNSIFLRHEGVVGSSDEKFSLERAKCWILCANEVVNSRQVSAEAVDVTVAVVIWITIYCEVPMTRPVIVRDMLKTFTVDTELGIAETTESLAPLYCLVISSVIQTLSDDEDSKDQSLELDRVADVFEKPLLISMFVDLAESLSPLASARRVLLKASAKKLETTFQVQECSSLENVRHSTEENVNKLKCGLFGLLTIVGSSVWNGCEADGWKRLSDIITGHEPCISVDVRSWLFDEIKQAVTKNRLDQRTVEHLLRACLARLLSFVGPDRDGQEVFFHQKAFAAWNEVRKAPTTRSKQVEDIVGLVDLVFTLLHYSGVKDEEKSERQEVFASCRRSLLALLDTKAPPSAKFNVASKAHFSLPRLNNGCLHLDVYVAFYCFLTAAKGVLGVKVQFAGCDLSTSTQMKALIADKERTELLSAFGHDSLPEWLKPPGPKVVDGSDLLQSSTLPTSCIRCGMLDAVIELLVGQRWLSSNGGDLSGLPMSDLRVLSLHLSAVLRLRRRVTNVDSGKKEEPSVTRCHCQRLSQSFDSFCEVLIPVIEQSLKDVANFVGTENMVSAVLDICEITCSSAAESELFEGFSGFYRRLNVLWMVYRSLCGEEASFRVISFLESHCPGEGEQVFHGTPIRCPDDIYSAVRALRLSVLRALSTNLDFYEWIEESVEPEPVFGGRTSQSGLFELLLKLIFALSADLRAGLDCASGGLTYDMFEVYVDCIQQCAAILLDFASVVCADDGSRRSVLNTCEKAARLLEDILCNFALKKSAALKKTNLLIYGALPALARAIRRRCVLVAHTENSAVPYFDCTGAAIRSLTQLTNVLKQKVALGNDSLVISWEDVVGEEHLREEVQEDDDVSVTSEDSNDAVSTRKRPIATSSIEVHNDKLMLTDERMWTWSLCTVLQTFEDHWDEPEFSLHSLVRSAWSDSAITIYHECRRNEVSNILRNLGSLFETVVEKEKRTTTGRPIAVALPGAAKSRLFALIEHILINLQKSMKEMAAIFRKPKFRGSEAGPVFCVEALSCLSAWLSLQTEGTEFLTGVQRWYAAERSIAAKPLSGLYNVELPVLRRFPKLIFRVEEVESSLRDLSHTANEWQRSRKGCQCAAELRLLDDLTSNADSKNCDGAFADLVSSKLKFLVQQQITLRIEFGLTPSSNRGSKRKRKAVLGVGRMMQKQRRRRMLRSRNAVIDKWLQRDRELGYEEENDDDAFADLEDFLVEG